MDGLPKTIRRAVYLTFIPSFGLEPNEHSVALVQNSLTMDALFEQV